jgi:two-component system chemotaxis response regulator CheB
MPPDEAARVGAPRKAAVRVLVVDDSALVRREIKRLLSRDPDIEVIGGAADVYEARDRLIETEPDVMTLDLDMPRMDGLTFLGKLARYRPVPVVVVTSMTARGGQLAMDAIDAGATEVVPKPGLGYSPAEMAQDLVHAVKAAARASRRRPPGRPALAPGVARLPSAPAPARGLIAIGASTGGPQAIEGLLQAMPLDAPPIVVVQHMPPVFTRSFAQRLASATSFDVREAADGDALAPGRVLIAPGGRQMRVRVLPGSGAHAVEVREGERVNHHCPSVDVLFASVARAAGRSAVGVLLTGMGSDGAAGLLEMRQAGAITLAQGEAGCVVFGMPRAAAEMGAAEELVALEHLPRRILAAVSRR